MSLTLKRNGVVQNPSITGHGLVRLSQSFLKPFELAVRRAIPFDDTQVWQNEEAFSLAGDGLTLFDGLLKSNRRDAATDRDDTSYVMLGLEAKVDRIIFTKGSARVVYNAASDDAVTGDYTAALAGLSVGEIIADVLDTMCWNLGGILGDGTVGSGYVPEELALLTMIPPKTVFSGRSVGQCIRQLMRYVPQYGAWLDPAARKLRVVSLDSLEDKTVTVGSDDVIQAHLEFSTEGCFTACSVEGAGELVDEEKQLLPAWDSQLETSWTIQKAFEQPETYGRVWRRFACLATNLAQSRVVGSGPRILVNINNGWQQLYLVLTEWADVDFETGEIELPWLARQWNNQTAAWNTATVRMRYTYRYGPISARWPRIAFQGTAYTNRGLTAENIIVDRDAMRVTVTGTVNSVESNLVFRDFLIGLKPGEVAGREIAFGNGRRVIVANGANSIELNDPVPLQVGDTFTIYLQDDTQPLYEGGTISKMELEAREWLKARKDEKYHGVVPLAGIDLSVRLGQRIDFAGTDNPFYTSLGATLVEVIHDFAKDRTELVLTSERLLSQPKAWPQEQAQESLEQNHRDLRTELALLRRAVGKGRAVLFDGDRDSRLQMSPNPPFNSLGKYGDSAIFTGDVKLEEDNSTTPSVAITPMGEHNSLKLGLNFAQSGDIKEVSLNSSGLGTSGRVPDASHQHPLKFNNTLVALQDNVLSHAPKESFEEVEEVTGYYFSITWDTAYGHVVALTSQGG